MHFTGIQHYPHERHQAVHRDALGYRAGTKRHAVEQYTAVYYDELDVQHMRRTSGTSLGYAGGSTTGVPGVPRAWWIDGTGCQGQCHWCSMSAASA